MVARESQVEQEGMEVKNTVSDQCSHIITVSDQGMEVKGRHIDPYYRMFSRTCVAQ